MSASQPSPGTGRTRREPPAFRPVAVRHVERLSPRLVRVTFTGPSLEGLVVDDPAASVRLLLTTSEEPVVTWNGNEFLMPDGRRPTIRTFTPVRVATDSLELDLDIVLHGKGAAAEWAATAAPGDRAAVSGPGRGYVIDPSAPTFFLAGDESAIPAIRQLLERLPVQTPAEVHIEVAQPDARLPLRLPDGATVEWHDLPPGAASGQTLVTATTEAVLAPGAAIWVAGEAAAVQRIRRHLFEERSRPRGRATVRGYWKHGRSAGSDEE